jgi:transposase InsO family protein
LAAILDLYSRFIVGWAVSALNDPHLTIKALEMALKRRCPDVGLLHHSDQGCTYASEDYEAILDARGITCSISRRGNCYDDGVMESFFSTVKSELADRFDSFGDGKMELFDYIEVFYNQRAVIRPSGRSARRPLNDRQRPHEDHGGALGGSHSLAIDDDGQATEHPSAFSDRCKERFTRRS